MLTSALSRALPVPDAALGAVAYLAEAVLTALGRPDRPKVVLASAVVAAGLGLAALGLIAARPRPLAAGPGRRAPRDRAALPRRHTGAEDRVHHG